MCRAGLCWCRPAVDLKIHDTATDGFGSFNANDLLDFSMTASYIEACSCDMFCPCYFNNHSTMHGDKQFCRANLVLKVDTGYYKSVKLDGAKVWVSTDLGSDWSTGKIPG
jgi:hypothetical protein